ncbi:MAG: hypothetical protein WAV05_14070 [Anaerolineales bacterium]
MMICPKCGYENPDSATNCGECHVNLKWAIENKDYWKGEEEQRQLKIEAEKRLANFMVTTTPVIQGFVIEEYLGIVASNVVLVC